MAPRRDDTHEVSTGRLLARLVAALLALWLAAIGHALLWPKAFIAASLPPIHLGQLEAQRPLLGVFAFVLAALVVVISLLRPRRPSGEPEARVVTPPAWRGQEERPLAPFPLADAAEPAVKLEAVDVEMPATELIEAAVMTDPVVTETAAASVEPETDSRLDGVETETLVGEIDVDGPIVHPLLEMFDPEAEVAPVLEAIPAVLSSPSNEGRRAKLRLLAQQVAALAASLSALAGEAPPEETSPDAPRTVEAAIPEQPAEPEAIRDARAALEHAPGGAGRAALAYTLTEAARHAADAGDASNAVGWLKEAFELRRHLAVVSVSQDARFAEADTAAQLADAYAAAGEPDKAKTVLQASLTDLAPMVANTTRYADLVYEAKVKLIGIEKPAPPEHRPAEMDPIL